MKKIYTYIANIHPKWVVGGVLTIPMVLGAWELMAICIVYYGLMEIVYKGKLLKKI